MRKLDHIAQNESNFDKTPVNRGKAPENWEKGNAILNFSINGKDFNIDIYNEMIIQADNIIEMNKIATHACADAIFWGGVCKKVQTKLNKFKEIDMKKYEAHVYKWAKYMSIGEGSKGIAGDVSSKKYEAFSSDLLPSEDDEEELKSILKWHVECAIMGFNKSQGRDFSRNPITTDEFDRFFGLIYRDNYNIFEINIEFMADMKAKLEEKNGILELITKLMVDKRTTLVSTVSNNIRSEQDLFGKDGYKTAISEFNKQLLNDDDFKKIVKKLVN